MTIVVDRVSAPACAPGRRSARKIDFAALRAVWKPLIILYLLVVLRSVVQIVFAQFLPLYLHRERGFSLIEAASALIAVSSRGRDRRLRRRPPRGPFRRTPRHHDFHDRLRAVSGAVFLDDTDPLSMIGLALGGLILLFTIPVNVVMAQELAPSQAGHGLRADDGLRLGHRGPDLHSADRLGRRTIFRMQHACAR